MKDGGYFVGLAGKWHHTKNAGGHVHEISKELGMTHISNIVRVLECMKNSLEKN